MNKFAKEFENHMSGIIGAERLKESEAQHHIALLYLALQDKEPVAKAQFYGFNCVSSHEDILEYLSYLETV